MTRFIKTLIIINGLIIPAAVCFLLYKLISESLRDNDYQPESIIVGEDLGKAKKDSLALQGIAYETPMNVYNSTNYYLPISVKSYEEAKDLKTTEGVAYLKLGRTSGYNYASYSNYFNILFLDKDYKVIGQLGEKKASITEIFSNVPTYGNQEEIDKSVKNMAYVIGFDDSNKDGKLNSFDFHDLYISDLDGRSLIRVTSGKEIIDFNFMNSNTEIFIRYKDRNEIKEEYKHIKFGLYTIATGTFKELNEIEQKLLEIESKLIQ
jgi:hypothetical protein